MWLDADGEDEKADDDDDDEKWMFSKSFKLNVSQIREKMRTVGRNQRRSSGTIRKRSKQTV